MNEYQKACVHQLYLNVMINMQDIIEELELETLYIEAKI